MVVNSVPVPSALSELPNLEWTSGEELETNLFSTEPRASTKLMDIIKKLIHEVTAFRDQFVEDFQKPVEEIPEYRVPSIPDHLTKTPCFSNYSKEPCLQEISRGLQVYQVLLQYAHTQYPQSSEIPNVRDQTNILIMLVKGKMKAGTENLTDSEKKHVLGKVPTKTEWDRKRSVHAILRDLRHFLVDSKKALCRMGNRGDGCQ
ncbi:hypothetical protein DPEC_G00285830 [Dallia pectoralis]|uniref:Uncharacterized protein n=1 Tax=Dallia pectoralis TaxID=75939 RepID=A0ACC2FJS2_DALPE|nr:hypothetical protein DPEC_G00285830 [Dallia pectoralis]